MIIIWRFSSERVFSHGAERCAQKLVAIQFFLLGPYVGMESVRVLIDGEYPTSASSASSSLSARSSSCRCSASPRNGWPTRSARPRPRARDARTCSAPTSRARSWSGSSATRFAVPGGSTGGRAASTEGLLEQGERMRIEHGCCPFFELDLDPGRRLMTVGVVSEEHGPALDAIAPSLEARAPAQVRRTNFGNMRFERRLNSLPGPPLWSIQVIDFVPFGMTVPSGGYRRRRGATVTVRRSRSIAADPSLVTPRAVAAILKVPGRRVVAVISRFTRRPGARVGIAHSIL
jgi:hypothetical protein